MEARRRSLEERPRLFREFVEELKRVLGDRASLILFGGRARAGVEAVEPRDYDLLVVVRDEGEAAEVEELVYRVKPRRLPVDILVATVEWLETPLARQMLQSHVILHDPLNVKRVLGGSSRDRVQVAAGPWLQGRLPIRLDRA